MLRIEITINTELTTSVRTISNPEIGYGPQPVLGAGLAQAV
jgi:hypothetical protein